MNLCPYTVDPPLTKPQKKTVVLVTNIDRVLALHCNCRATDIHGASMIAYFGT